MSEIGLGFLGFIEPCSIGSSLIFIKYLEGKDVGGKLGQVTVGLHTVETLLRQLIANEG